MPPMRCRWRRCAPLRLRRNFCSVRIFRSSRPNRPLSSSQFSGCQPISNTHSIEATRRGCGPGSRNIDSYLRKTMLVIIRDRVQALIKTGATLEQVKAARVTADYDTRYGAASGPWTTDMFVEAVYTSLKQVAPPQVRQK